MPTSRSLRPLAPVAIVLGTIFAGVAHADVARDSVPPAPTADVVLLRQAVANLSVLDFRAVPQPEEQNQAADLTNVPEDPAVPEAIGPGSLLFPMLIIVLAGSIRRYYTSAAYKSRQLYESIYGPLSPF